jgi:deoxyribonuclease V
MTYFPMPTNLEEAKKLQLELREQVIQEDCLEFITTIAGVDVGFESNYTIAKAAVVVLNFPSLEVKESQIARVNNNFPYVPGFLSFREVPAILAALEKLTPPPDLIMCDGQGIAHPRRFGIACHLGVILDLPTLGVAKSLLVGQHLPLGNDKGDWQYLSSQGETIGIVLRSRTNVKPLYISPGHKISLPKSLDYVLACLTKYRLPETTRLADKLTKQS